MLLIMRVLYIIGFWYLYNPVFLALEKGILRADKLGGEAAPALAGVGITFFFLGVVMIYWGYKLAFAGRLKTTAEKVFGFLAYFFGVIVLSHILAAYSFRRPEMRDLWWGYRGSARWSGLFLAGAPTKLAFFLFSLGLASLPYAVVFGVSKLLKKHLSHKLHLGLLTGTYLLASGVALVLFHSWK